MNTSLRFLSFIFKDGDNVGWIYSYSVTLTLLCAGIAFQVTTQTHTHTLVQRKSQRQIHHHVYSVATSLKSNQDHGFQDDSSECGSSSEYSSHIRVSFSFFASFSTGIRYKKFSLLMTNICLGMQFFFRHCVVFCVFLGGLQMYVLVAGVLQLELLCAGIWPANNVCSVSVF